MGVWTTGATPSQTPYGRPSAGVNVRRPPPSGTSRRNDPLADVGRLSELNRDVWAPFRAAYAHGDPEAFIALHAPDVIRVEGNGGREGGFGEAAGRLRDWFQWVAVQEGELDIRFRFLERYAGD